MADSRMVLAVIAAVSAAILGAALASQYFGGLAPCKLCLYQRWPYVVTIVAGAGGAALLRSVRWRTAAIGLCAAAFAVGAAVAVYHTGVEQHWFAGPASCSGTVGNPETLEELRRQLLAAPVVRCDEIPWSLFGISLAGYNALASLALAGFSLLAMFQASRSEAL